MTKLHSILGVGHKEAERIHGNEGQEMYLVGSHIDLGGCVETFAKHWESLSNKCEDTELLNK